MRFFKYSWQLNEAIDRNKIYNSFLQKRKLYIPETFDAVVNDLVNQRITRPELNKVKDKIVICICRLIAEAVSARLQEDANRGDLSDDIELAKDLVEISTKGPVNTAESVYDNMLKNQLEADLEDGLVGILDYINSPLRNVNTEPINFDTVTWRQLTNASSDFHQRLAAEVGDKYMQISEETGKVIMQFDDGFYWIDLETTSDAAEARIMGHCGTDTSANTIYSLRKRVNVNGELELIQPHLTASIKFEMSIEYGQDQRKLNKGIAQLKGKGNSKPKPEYYKYITELLEKSDIGFLKTWVGYKPELNFHITDLDNESVERVLIAKPKMLEYMFQKAYLAKPDFIKANEELPVMVDALIPILVKSEMKLEPYMIIMLPENYYIEYCLNMNLAIKDTYIDKLTDDQKKKYFDVRIAKKANLRQVIKYGNQEYRDKVINLGNDLGDDIMYLTTEELKRYITKAYAKNASFSLHVEDLIKVKQINPEIYEAFMDNVKLRLYRINGSTVQYLKLMSDEERKDFLNKILEKYHSYNIFEFQYATTEQKKANIESKLSHQLNLDSYEYDYLDAETGEWYIENCLRKGISIDKEVLQFATPDQKIRYENI